MRRGTQRWCQWQKCSRTGGEPSSKIQGRIFGKEVFVESLAAQGAFAAAQPATLISLTRSHFSVNLPRAQQARNGSAHWHTHTRPGRPRCRFPIMAPGRKRHTTLGNELTFTLLCMVYRGESLGHATSRGHALAGGCD